MRYPTHCKQSPGTTLPHWPIRHISLHTMATHTVNKHSAHRNHIPLEEMELEPHKKPARVLSHHTHVRSVEECLMDPVLLEHTEVRSSNVTPLNHDILQLSVLELLLRRAVPPPPPQHIYSEMCGLQTILEGGGVGEGGEERRRNREGTYLSK